MLLTDIANALKSFFPQKVASPVPQDQNMMDPAARLVMQQRAKFGLPALSQATGDNQIQNVTSTPPPQAQPHQGVLGAAMNLIHPQIHQAQAQQAQPNAAPTEAPDQPIPSGVDLAMNYLRQQTPGGKDPMQYFKAFQDPNFLPKILAADKIRPGLANELLVSAFHESTLGNANNGNNIFGALPGGEGSGKQAAFDQPSDAVDYQLSKAVLGNPNNKNMNLEAESGPLTLKRVQQLYQSYDPHGAYVQTLLHVLNNKNN